MKKIFVLLAVMLFPAVATAENRWFVLLGAGGGNTRMSAYNSEIDGLRQDYLGYDVKLNGLNYDSSIMVCPGYYIAPGVGIYFKAEKIFISDDSGRISGGGSVFFKSDVRFDAAYFALGVKKYLQDFIPTYTFIPFFAADAGIAAASGDYKKFKTYSAGGGELQYKECDLSGIMFGACAEAGMDYYLTQWFGFDMKAGYRYTAGSISGPVKTNIAGSESSYRQDLEYSGVYIGAGTIFSF